MPVRTGSFSSCLAGSRDASEVRDQVDPFQWATSAPSKAQMSLPDRPLPPSRPWPDSTWVQAWPLKCQAPRSAPGTSGSPTTQTSAELSTTTLPIAREKDRTTVQCWPFQRSARDFPNSSVTAQTLVAELASAATTISLLRLGKGTCVQLDPFRSQAVALVKPSNAHPPCGPAAVTAVKTPLGPLETRLTMCQDGAEVGAANAACAQPATATTAAASTAARRTLIFICFQPSKKPLGPLISPRMTAEARI